MNYTHETHPTELHNHHKPIMDVIVVSRYLHLQPSFRLVSDKFSILPLSSIGLSI